MDSTDFLWNLAAENLEYCRHHENQRQGVANFAFVAAGVLVSVVSLDQRLTDFDLLPTAILIMIGLFGAVVSHKHYERFDHHYERFRGIRAELEKRLQVDIRAINAAADTRHETQFPYTAKRRLSRFWFGLHLIIVAVGVVLLVLIGLAT